MISIGNIRLEIYFPWVLLKNYKTVSRNTLYLILIYLSCIVFSPRLIFINESLSWLRDEKKWLISDDETVKRDSGFSSHRCQWWRSFLFGRAKSTSVDDHSTLWFHWLAVSLKKKLDLLLSSHSRRNPRMNFTTIFWKRHNIANTTKAVRLILQI